MIQLFTPTEWLLQRAKRFKDRNRSSSPPGNLLFLSLLFLLTIGMSLKVNAQGAIPLYSFSSSSGSWTANSGGTTIIAAGTDDGNSAATNIGFSFNFGGTVFTQFVANSNGSIRFGTAGPTSQYLPISTNGNTNAIAGLARDGRTGGAVNTLLSGTAPNRVLTIEYPTFNLTYSTSANTQSFQIKLYETTNVVQIVYGPTAGTTSYTPQVGLRGGAGTAADYNNRTTTTNWAASTPGGTNAATMSWTSTVKPASGLTYTWTPPTPCVGTPTPGNTLASVNPLCSGATTVLSLQNATSGSGVTYQWQSSTDNITYNNVAGATGTTYTATFTGAIYYRCNVTCSGNTGTSTPINLTQDLLLNCYCASGATTGPLADEDITNVTFGPALNNNSTYNSVAGAGPGSIAGQYSNFKNLGAFNVSKVINTTFSITTFDNAAFFYDRRVGIFIDGNQDGDFNDAGETVYQETVAPGGSATGTWVHTGTVNLPIGFLDGNTVLRVVCSETTTPVACGTYGWGETEDYLINIQTPAICTATPPASNALSSAANVCSGANFNLSLSTAYTLSGYVFQWQSSPDNSTWTNILGANSSTLTTNQAAATYYRCVITCTGYGVPTNSGSVQVTMSAPSSCICASSATSDSDEDVTNVTIGTLNNSSACGALAPGVGSVAYRYSNYRTLSAPNLNLSQSYPISVRIEGCDGYMYTAGARVFIDFNQDGDFADAGETVFTSAQTVSGGALVQTLTGSVLIPCSATLGVTAMRVVMSEGDPTTFTSCMSYSWGETEDYLVNITNAAACSGTPAASNTLSSVANVCVGSSFNLSLSGSYPSCDFTFGWESSTDGGTTWIPLGGTSATLTIASQAVTTEYRCVVTCTNGGASITTTPVTVTNNPVYNCYCTSESTDAGADEDIFNVTLLTLNNSSTCATTGGAGSSLNEYSNYTALAPVTLVKTEINSMSVTVGTCGSSYNGRVKVWIDYNRNGVFDNVSEVAVDNGLDAGPFPKTYTFNVTVPITAATGLTGMRVMFQETFSNNGYLPCGTYGYGETEDYVVDMVNPPSCAGTPTPGTLPSTLQLLNNTSTLLSPVGLGIALNNTYEWEESNDNGGSDPWAPAVGGSGAATYQYTTPNLNTTIWYRLKVTCTTSGLTDYTNAIQITTVGGASCADPYIVASLPFSLNFSSAGAGNDIGTQTSTCSNLYGSGNDVVFRFTAPATGLYEISLANTSNTKNIGWFLKDNANCSTTSSSLACAVSTATYNSAHDLVSLTAGQQYFVIVDYASPVTQSNFFIRIRQVPAAPANDNCATATSITQSATPTCSAPVVSTLAGATASGVAVQCSGGNADDDVWYSFVATSDAAVIQLSTTTNGVVESGSNLAWEAFSGTCGSLTPLFCRNASASRGVNEDATIVGLTIGQTYFIRIYDMAAGYGSAGGNFTLCLFTPPPPANNECAGATVLAVGATCTTVSGNTVAATQSLAASACNGYTGNADDDIWYSFTLAAATTVDIQVTASNNTMDPVVQLFNGSCGALNSVDCADRSLAGGFERINRPLPAGVYFVRVYHYGVGTGAGGSHTICVTTAAVAGAPTNDNTCSATTLPMGTECSPEGPYSGSGSTRTLNLTLAQQGDGTPNDDVWFKFTTNGGQTSATINVQGAGGYDAVFQVFAMSNCKTLTGIFPPVDATLTNGAESQTVFGLTGSTTYYVRVFDWYATNPTGSFTICVYETPTPPNDKLINSELLFQQNSLSCFSPTFGYTISASAGDATATCGGTADDNVWYSFVATNTTATITVTGTQGFDPIVNLRTGAGAATSVSCASATGADGVETINATGLTIGQTYYIQVYSPGTGAVGQGTFEICVFGPPAPPANDNCAGAFALPNTSPCTPVPGILTGATVSLPANCASFSSTAYDVWYSFIASTSTATLTPVGASGATDMVVEVFGGACGSLTSLGCANNNPAPGVENLVINSLTPGQLYTVRVYANSTIAPGSIGGPNPNFTLCYTGVPPGNDNICGATLTTVSSGRVDINTNNLGATNTTTVPPDVPNLSFAFSSWNNDVWFKSVVPANGVIAINCLPIGFNDSKIRVYSSSDNTCSGTLTCIAWDDDNGSGLGSFVYLNGLTPGNTIFYAIDGYSATNFGQFRINVNDGWLWTGAGGFAATGTNVWINHGASDATPNPGSTVTVAGGTGWANNPTSVIINIPTTTNQPVFTTSQNIGGVKFVGGVFTQSKFTVNAGQIVTLNGATFAGSGRGITGVSAGGRIEGAGRLDITAATAGTTVSVAYPTRFRLATSVLANPNVQSNGNMIFDNGASLYSGQNAPNSLVNGNITYRRQGNGSQYVYNFWSSPISNGTLASLAAPGYIPNLYEYFTPNALGLDYLGTQAGWLPRTPSTPMVVGQGYIATGAGLASFTGLPNQTSPVGPALLNGSGGNNFNLVGNPYPAPVSVASFLAANSANISGAVYVWDDDASGGANYAAGDFIISNGIGTVNGPNSGLPFSGNIASCQGFFVEKTSGGAASIQFTHAMKTYGTNSEFFDVTTASRMRLRMENVNGQGTETIIAFIDDATEGVDNQYDATSFPGNADLTMYTFNGEGRYVIQAWPVLNTERVIDLGVVNTVVGTSRIRMNMFENFDASTVVYVEDVQEGIFHNLTQDGDYVYNNTGLTGEQPVRFRIHFRAPIAVASSMDCSGQEMGKIIVANPNTTPVTLEVVNEMNAVVATAAAFTGEHEVSGLAAGTYTLNMSYPEGTQISRNAVVETNGMTAPATFIASATTVSIADAIIEFQGTAQGATTYMWDFGDGSAIVTGDMNPVHAYDAPGVYTVTFTALANGCGSSATTTITVTNETTGIANVSGNNGFTIYPNPASDVANLLLNVDKSTTDVTISIQDAAGRLVSTQQVNEVRSGAIIALPVDALVNGVYQVTVEGKNFRNVGRLTIAK